MISFDYKPQGVCSRNIHLNLSDDGSKVLGVEFTGGCDGNLKAISKLVEGAPADRVIEVLAGNTCGMIAEIKEYAFPAPMASIAS